MEHFDNADFKGDTLKEMGYTLDNVQDAELEKDDLSEDIFNMLKNHEFTNLKIIIDGVEFNCHLLVLQCVSKYFKEMDGEDRVLYYFPENVTARAFSKMYEWYIEPNFDIMKEHVVELFMAARYLELDNVVDHCWTVFNDPQRSDEDKAFELYMEAKTFRSYIVKGMMFSRIVKYFLIMVSRVEFVEFELGEVVAFLSSNTIGVNNELEVLMSGIRWLLHDWNNRKKHMLEVVKCTRFFYLSPLEVLDLQDICAHEPFDNEVLNEFIKNSELGEIVKSVLAFLVAEPWSEGNHIRRSELYKILDQNEPEPRCWISDPLKKEFHGTNIHVAYTMFKNYLQKLSTMEPQYFKTFVHTQAPLPFGQIQPGMKFIVIEFFLYAKKLLL